MNDLMKRKSQFIEKALISQQKGLHMLMSFYGLNAANTTTAASK